MKLNATPLSMVNPSTDSMLKQAHSRYALVVLASKRARELLSGKPCRVESHAGKNLTNAMEEINEGKITYEIRD